MELIKKGAPDLRLGDVPPAIDATPMGTFRAPPPPTGAVIYQLGSSVNGKVRSAMLFDFPTMDVGMLGKFFARSCC